MITSPWGAFWAVVIIMICAAQFGYKGFVADEKQEEGIVAFIIVAVIEFVRLCVWLWWISP